MPVSTLINGGLKVTGVFFPPLVRSGSFTRNLPHFAWRPKIPPVLRVSPRLHGLPLLIVALGNAPPPVSLIPNVFIAHRCSQNDGGCGRSGTPLPRHVERKTREIMMQHWVEIALTLIVLKHDLSNREKPEDEHVSSAHATSSQQHDHDSREERSNLVPKQIISLV